MPTGKVKKKKTKKDYHKTKEITSTSNIEQIKINFTTY